MATTQQLKASARQHAGRGTARALRREGRVPGVVYGDPTTTPGGELPFIEVLGVGRPPARAP